MSEKESQSTFIIYICNPESGWNIRCMSNFCISNPDVGPMENLHQPFVVTLLQSKLTDRWPIAATQI